MAVETLSDAATDDTTPGPTLSVVAPCYNEAGNLTPLVREISDALTEQAPDTYRPYEVLLVDDGSTDETRQEIRELAALFEEVEGVFLTRNFGQSGALSAGIEHARGRYVVTIDADLQNDPADIPRLLARLQDGYDCVSGWRRDRDDPLSKTIPSRIQTRLAKRTGPDINDFGCTLTAYRARALEDVDLRGERHRYIPSQLHEAGYRIDELEVEHRPRANGETKYGTGRLVRGFVDLVYHWFRHRYGARPMHLLGGLGFVLLTVGGFVGGVSVIQRYLLATPLTPRLPRLIFVSLAIVTGLLFVGFGFLAEMVSELQYQDGETYRVERVIER